MRFVEVDINYIDLLKKILNINNIFNFLFICPKTREPTEDEWNDHIYANMPKNHCVNDMIAIKFIREHKIPKYNNYYLWNVYQIIFTNENFFLKILEDLDRYKKIRVFV
jgi:hypothetical protein